LATTDDARVHCAVLKIRAVPGLLSPAGERSPVRRGNLPCGRSLRTQQRARLVHSSRDRVPAPPCV
jgi:hypothetical protein